MCRSLLRESLLEDILNLLLVAGLQQMLVSRDPECYRENHAYLATSGDGASRRTADVARVLALVVLSLVGSGEQTRAHVGPGTVVERLFLTPNQVGVGVLVEMRSELGERAISVHERIKVVFDENSPCHTGMAKAAQCG